MRSNQVFSKFVKKKHQTPGQSPGTMIHVGEKKTETVHIGIFEYDASSITYTELDSALELETERNKPGVRWINVDGLHDVDCMTRIGGEFGIHPLIMEDILDTDQRPKLDVQGDYIFLLLKMITFDKAADALDIEQVSFIVGGDFVITFQEKPGDVFDPVRERLRALKGRIRKLGADYLAYALVDVVVDNYFLVLERIGEQLEDLEDDIIGSRHMDSSRRIHQVKRELLFLRKSIWPLRELITGLLREENTLILDATRPYLRDVYDHTIQVIDTIETYRDMASGILDIYLSSVSNRMNEVMKVLTVIATIFIPLTFMTSLYGMNFEWMPELHFRYGYPIVLGVMLLVVGGMLRYFRKKKWM